MSALSNIYRGLFLLMATGTFNYADSASVRCYNGSLDNYVTIPLSNPRLLMSSTCVNKSLPTVVYTHGYRGLPDGPATTAVLSAYMALQKFNVLLLEWAKEAAAGAAGYQITYVASALPNAMKLGAELGIFIVELNRDGYNMTQLHLVGHSLGAHLMGYAGRTTSANGFVVPWITGLDPAKPLFEGALSTHTPLDRSCAEFVDIWHTDPARNGMDRPTGSADIYFNYAGDKTLQPGCPVGTFDEFSVEGMCSHNRCWEFLREALAPPTSFLAASAPDYKHWASKDFQVTGTIFLGELIDKRARGNYYLTTNAASPYGKGEAGLMSNGTT